MGNEQSKLSESVSESTARAEVRINEIAATVEKKALLNYANSSTAKQHYGHNEAAGRDAALASNSRSAEARHLHTDALSTSPSTSDRSTSPVSEFELLYGPSTDLSSEDEHSPEGATTPAPPVYPQMGNKRPLHQDDTSEDDEERFTPPPKKTTRRRAKPALSNPPYKATVEKRALDDTTSAGSALSEEEKLIFQRIQKCLDRANHPSASEQEAKAAFHLANRLMEQHKIFQAEVLAHASVSEQKQYAGQSDVSIRHWDKSKKTCVRHHAYLNHLAGAMEVFFDCKSYSTARASSLQWTFYGIAANTVTAAKVFEAAYNFVARKAQLQKGVKAKNSYCLGISWELLRMAEREKALQEAQAKEAERNAIICKAKSEEAERQRHLDRLAPAPTFEDEPPTPKPSFSAETGGNDTSNNGFGRDQDYIEIYSDSDNDDDIGLQGNLDSGVGNDDGEGGEDSFEPTFKVNEGENLGSFLDVDEEITKLACARSTIPPETDVNTGHHSTTEAALDRTWESHMQLVIFRGKAMEIAQQYAKDQDMKLRKGRARSNVIRDRNAYEQGKNDSKEFDAHRKRITDKEDVMDS